MATDVLVRVRRIRLLCDFVCAHSCVRVLAIGALRRPEGTLRTVLCNGR